MECAMSSDALIGLINNAVLLLGLVLVYTFIPQRSESNTQLHHTISGLLLGGISALIMLNPWYLEPGVQFDTRSILLSITGLYFKPRAAVIAAVITSIVRIIQGGGGAFTGVSVIIMSVSVGILWRRQRNADVDSLSWRELYAFGWVVHIFMVLLMLTMPRAIVWDVLKSITLPVLAIYPVGTLLVGKLLEREQSRRLSEIAIRQSEERFRRAMENIPDVVVIYDRDLRIQYINPATHKLSGRAVSEFIGRQDADIWPPEVYAPYMPTLEESRKTKTMRSIEVDLTLPGTGTRTLAITCVPLLDEHGEVREVLGITHDFTERKQAEREIRQLNESLEQRIAERTAQLEAKTRELETFTYSVSHDLKAPLRGIDGYSRLLMEDYSDRVDEEGRSFLHNIQRAATQMNQLIEDLLAFSRLERRDLRRAPVDLHALAHTLVAEYAREIEEHDVAVTVDLPPETIVLADVHGLAMALRNLLDNALKFTAKTKNPRIEIGGRDEKLMYNIWVRDNGIGFDMRYHDRIFDIFHRLHRAEDYAGTGVGLAIVQKAMQRMGGRTWAESAPERGATFYLELPRTS